MQVSDKFNNFYKTIINIYNHGGLKRFWNGSSVISIGCVPAHAAYFSVYEYSKFNLGVDNLVYKILILIF